MNLPRVLIKGLLAAFTGAVFMIVLGDYFDLSEFWRTGVFVLTTFAWWSVLLENE
jgi:hypothetical protein